MKKLIYACSVLALLFTSCSGDDNTPMNPSDDVLLKRDVYTETGMPSEENTYTYNGTKLTRIDYSAIDSYSLITYQGDLITKIQYYDVDDVVTATETFTYDGNNRLITTLYIDPGNDVGLRESHTHNGDGTITVNHYSGDAIVQNTLSKISKVFFTAGEVTKIENYSDAMVLYSTDTFTYDGKNNPFRNVTGYAAISFTDGMPEGKFQNVVQDHRAIEMLDNEYTYNVDFYATSQTSKDSDGDVVSTTQYFYE